jgi:hypothetical protein
MIALIKGNHTLTVLLVLLLAACDSSSDPERRSESEKQAKTYFPYIVGDEYVVRWIWGEDTMRPMTYRVLGDTLINDTMWQRHVSDWSFLTYEHSPEFVPDTALLRTEGSRLIKRSWYSGLLFPSLTDFSLDHFTDSAVSYVARRGQTAEVPAGQFFGLAEVITYLFHDGPDVTLFSPELGFVFYQTGRIRAELISARIRGRQYP